MRAELGPRRPAPPAAWLALPLAIEAFTQPLTGGDETWFLQVLDRVSRGDVLYRDVSFGTLPLSVWLSSPLMSLAGPEIWVLRLAGVLVQTAEIALACRIARSLGAGRGARVLLGAAILGLGARSPGTLYSPLAWLLLLGTFAAVLLWGRLVRAGDAGGAGRAAALAGFLAGLAFLAKHNVGALSAAAAGIAILGGAAGPDRRRALVLASCAFAAPVILALVGVAGEGGLPGLLDYAFTGKGAYLRLGSRSYGLGLLELARAPALPPLAAVKAVFRNARFLVPPLALAALIAAERRKPSGRGEPLAVNLFSAAAFLGIFPRADDSHVAFALPILLLGFVHAAVRLDGTLNARRAAMLGTVAGLFLAARAAGWTFTGLLALASGSARPSRLPHTHLVVVGREREEELRAASARVASFAAGRPLFVLAADASLWYLLSGVRNPTPFDYPYATTFGRTGQRDAREALEEGRLAAVCYAPAADRTLRAAELEDAVIAEMEPVAPGPPCVLYRRRPAGGRAPALSPLAGGAPRP